MSILLFIVLLSPHSVGHLFTSSPLIKLCVHSNNKEQKNNSPWTYMYYHHHHLSHTRSHVFDIKINLTVTHCLEITCAWRGEKFHFILLDENHKFFVLRISEYCVCINLCLSECGTETSEGIMKNYLALALHYSRLSKKLIEG